MDATYYATYAFTTHKYYDEMKGMADATGIKESLIRRVHMIGELTKGHCSMFGAWGKAT